MIAAEPMVLATAPPEFLAPVIEEKPAATPADNYFQDYGVNPFEDTREDHLSTFALDVDTASYTVARRYVNDGNLPPADAVRVEEFVNYFDQGYPNPPDVAFGIYADGAPSPFSYDGTYLLRIGVQGYEVPEAERKPAVADLRHRRLRLDGHGEPPGAGQAVAATCWSSACARDDTVGIVVYGSEARVVLDPTAGSDTDTILDAIDSPAPRRLHQRRSRPAPGLRDGHAAPSSPAPSTGSSCAPTASPTSARPARTPSSRRSAATSPKAST